MAIAFLASSADGPRSWIERLWSSIAERGRPYAAVPADAVAGLERARLLAEALLSGRGEASGAALARELHAVLSELGAAERTAFLRYLAMGFQPDPAILRAAAEAYLTDPGPATTARLARAAEPPRQELLRRMNLSPGGTAALVSLRAELLRSVRDNPELEVLDADLRHLFGSWFNRGFLELRRIDWQTPAAVLEKLIAYEAVHEIQGWTDLRRRLAADRRCFAFFHPALPGEPLIFVEVALVEGLAGAIQPLLASDCGDGVARLREARADAAMFYSISNCQDGLRGVSFGNFLIKQVVAELQDELPRLRLFSTLSPVPRFRRWLAKRLDGDGTGGDHDVSDIDGSPGLRAALEAGQWWHEAELAARSSGPLLRACARYLTQPGGGEDSVARFHLGNGARLERLNWLGNTAQRGIEESYGIMVNYLYDLASIEANHEAFVRNGTVVRSPDVDVLLAASPSDMPLRKAAQRRGHGKGERRIGA
jgi:malonyl-CoA decarboxylase